MSKLPALMLFKHLPQEVAAKLQSYLLLKRGFHFIRIIFITAIIYAVLALVVMHLDRFFFLDVAIRLQLRKWTDLSAAVCGGALLLLFFVRKKTARQIAYEFESRLSDDPEERFVTLENYYAQPDSEKSEVTQELARELEQATVKLSRELRPAKMVEDKWLRRAGWLGVAVMASITALSFPEQYQLALMLERFVSPEKNLPKPSFVKITVTPDKIRVGKGGEAVIQTEISGEIPAVFRWLLKRAGMTTSRCTIALVDGSEGKFAFNEAPLADMSRLLRSTFLFSRGGLENSFRYQIRCGDAQTEVRLAEVIAQPRILDARLTITPPEYSGLKEETITDFRRPMRLLPGTEVKFSFKSDQPLSKQELHFEKTRDPEELDWDEEMSAWLYEFKFKKKMSFEVRIENTVGFANVERLKVSLGLLEDSPPSVRLETPTSDVEKVPGELIPVQAVVEDDLGLQELSLRYTLNPSAEMETAPKEIPIPLETQGTKTINVKTAFDLDKTGAIPGDVIGLRLRARDSAGNDGESREIMIFVVSFTRGENERKRLAALRFVDEALMLISESKRPESSSPGLALDIEQSAFEKIQKAAKESGIELPGSPSILALLDLLELEHHLTDAATNKEDLRRISGLLLVACASTLLPEDPFAHRTEKLNELRTILRGLTHYRLLKNLTWRLFGMRYEALNIQEMLAGLDANASLEKSEAVQRRARLFLDTLQDIGDQLLNSARQIPQLEAAKLTAAVGELNTAAYYMKRGSTKKRMDSTGKVATAIASLITELLPHFSALLDSESSSRRQSSGLYDAALAAAGKQPRHENSIQFLKQDYLFQTQNPFGSAHGILTNAALGAGSKTPRAQTRSEPTGLHRAAYLWQADSVAGLEKISNTEKVIELHLLAAERRAYESEAATQLPQLKNLNSEQEVPIEEIVQAQPAVWPDGDQSARFSAALNDLHDDASELLAAQPTQKLLSSIVDDFDKALVAEKGLAQLQLQNKPEDAAKGLRQLVNIHQETLDNLKRVSDRLLLELYLDPQNSEGARVEMLLLKLREATSRFILRSATIVESLKKQAGNTSIGAAEITALSSDLQRYSLQMQSMKSRLENLREEFAGGTIASEEETAKYAIYEDFMRTREYVNASLSVRGPDAAKSAKAFVEKYPEAGIILLQANAARLKSAVAALHSARKILQSMGGKEPAESATEYSSMISKCLDQLRAFAGLLEQAGEGELQADTKVLLTEAEGRIARLDLKPEEAASKPRIQERLFVLEEALQTTRKIFRELESERETGGWKASFRGGPEGIWEKPYRTDAEHARRRLLSQASFARRQIVLGILEALDATPDRQRLEDGFTWSVFLFRLIRTELAGIGGQKPPATKGDQGGDPHLRFLMEELEKARKVRNLKNYAEPTKEYLDSVADFLRY
ncbi:MAG: hypothetical protein O3B01_06155 [Planctomycetota bacterium]|nr:hypothetical protein [Planctomycetota bacterium]